MHLHGSERRSLIVLPYNARIEDADQGELGPERREETRFSSEGAVLS